MSLKDVQIPKLDVVIAEGSVFAVRGLSVTDIEMLVRHHGEDLREVFDSFVNGQAGDLAKLEIMPIVKQLMARAPALIVDIIAVAADADEAERKVVAQLPAGVQLKALLSVATISLSVEGDMGKAMETSINVLGMVNSGMAEQLKAQAQSLPSTDGSGT